MNTRGVMDTTEEQKLITAEQRLINYLVCLTPIIQRTDHSKRSVNITEEGSVVLPRNAVLQEKTTIHVDLLAVNTILSPLLIWHGTIDSLTSQHN